MMSRILCISGLLLVFFLICPASAYADSFDSPDRDTLLRLIDDTAKTTPVIQPGSEEINRDLEAKKSFLEIIMDKLSEFFKKINDFLKRFMQSEAQSDLKPGFYGLNWLVVLIILGVLVFFLINLIPLIRRRMPGKTSIIENDEESYLSISMSKAIEKSELFANADNFTEALKELLRGFFMGLDEVSDIPYRSSRTNREYQRLIRRQASQYSNFAQEFLPYMEGILYAGINPEPSRYYSFRNSLLENFGIR